jgi:hypothetical protein
MVKSRMQTDGFTKAEGQKYFSTLEVITKTLKNEGPRAFTRGLGPALIRLVDISCRMVDMSHSCVTVHHLRTVLLSSGSRWRPVLSTQYSDTLVTSIFHVEITEFTVFRWAKSHPVHIIRVEYMIDRMVGIVSISVRSRSVVGDGDGRDVHGLVENLVPPVVCELAGLLEDAVLADHAAASQEALRESLLKLLEL